MNEEAERDRIDTICPNRAIVMGGSIAGLLAARVLSEYYDQVLVLERDSLPQRPALRKGTPQAAHAHALLVRGREILEQLFPGFTRSLARRGAFIGDMQHAVPVISGGRRFADGFDGRLGLSASRALIEHEIRQRVQALPNVRLCDRVDVIEPLYLAAGQQVAGVRVRVRRRAGDPAAIVHLLPGQVPDDAETWLADLVIDATGRGSRTPVWLREWGYASAPEERVDVNVNYATAYYERRNDQNDGRGGVLCTATAEHRYSG
ncbi:MAG TPA: hypothetical protein VKB34_19175, partial [Povalibacter sp.]|nr:hypothetical protein [Povalibacter sp.]